MRPRPPARIIRLNLLLSATAILLMGAAIYQSRIAAGIPFSDPRCLSHMIAARYFSYAATGLILVTIPLNIGWRLGDNKRRDRAERGLCVKCGYDLRASRDRCPECGTPMA
jgi:hypothetical protein